MKRLIHVIVFAMLLIGCRNVPYSNNNEARLNDTRPFIIEEYAGLKGQALLAADGDTIANENVRVHYADSADYVKYAAHVGYADSAKLSDHAMRASWALNSMTADEVARLSVPRTLWGNSFDGSANVTGDIHPASDNTGSIGADGLRWQYVNAYYGYFKSDVVTLENITAKRLIASGSTNDSVLLGGGGRKAISSFSGGGGSGDVNGIKGAYNTYLPNSDGIITIQVPNVTMTDAMIVPATDATSIDTGSLIYSRTLDRISLQGLIVFVAGHSSGPSNVLAVAQLTANYLPASLYQFDVGFLLASNSSLTTISTRSILDQTGTLYIYVPFTMVGGNTYMLNVNFSYDTTIPLQ